MSWALWSHRMTPAETESIVKHGISQARPLFNWNSSFARKRNIYLMLMQCNSTNTPAPPLTIQVREKVLGAATTAHPQHAHFKTRLLAADWATGQTTFNTWSRVTLTLTPYLAVEEGQQLRLDFVELCRSKKTAVLILLYLLAVSQHTEPPDWTGPVMLRKERDA